MNLLLLFVLCAVGLFAKSSLADEENEVKRGVFPYMAFVYYSDKTIVDRTGSRLTRGAILIRPDWLISSSLEDGETTLAFPKETFIARLGAIRIDSKFSLNEDEEEQEREIVQIAKPFNYKPSEWWVADITLLKTLLPFNISKVVAPVLINANPKADKACIILIYSAPNGNRSEDRLLMKLSVDMLPSTPESCGSNFVKSSMICAADGDDTKKESNYCEGNSGGPLICDNEVVGIQTYLSDCKPPHLFQHLTSWDNLITCAVEEKCHEEQCGAICNVINKDPLESPPQQLLAEAKTYPEENVNRSDEAGAPESMMRRLLPDGSKTIPDIDPNIVTNTDTTTTTSSTVYTNEKEIEISSEIEMVSSSVASNADDHHARRAPIVPTTFSYNTETETTNYMYKNEELVSKVEELKNLIEENASTDKTDVKAPEPKQKSLDKNAASVNTRYPCCLMFGSLILFYLQFSFIIN